jgi:uncharacterized protein (TIGR00251 family)
MAEIFWRLTSDGIVIRIHVQPRSSANQISGMYGDALKIKITAPPVDDAANRMCIAFLAKSLSLSSSRLEMLSGHASRSKSVLIRLYRPGDMTEISDLKRRILLMVPSKTKTS